MQANIVIGSDPKNSVVPRNTLVLGRFTMNCFARCFACHIFAITFVLGAFELQEKLVMLTRDIDDKQRKRNALRN